MDANRNAILVSTAMAIASLIVPTTSGAEQRCYGPQAPDDSPRFLAPKSPECRAFAKALDAMCGGNYDFVELKPGKVPGLVEPVWESLPLYDQSGKEVASGFDLLQRLARGRAIHRYFRDQEILAARDVSVLLAEIRQLRSDGKSALLDRSKLDVEGRGQEEVLYRLSLSTRSEIFLERALDERRSNDGTFERGHAYGSDLAGPSAGILLFGGTPYFVTREPTLDVLVYVAYLQRNRPLIYDEKAAGRTFAIPTLRCIFKPGIYNSVPTS